MASRIGELVVLGDRNTVFGGLDAEMESLPPEYRSHGSTSEAKVPLYIYNAERAPDPGSSVRTLTLRVGYSEPEAAHSRHTSFLRPHIPRLLRNVT
jgi:hypothetical protein